MAHYEADSLKRLVNSVTAHKQQSDQRQADSAKEPASDKDKPVAKSAPPIPPNVPLLKDMPKRS